MRTRQSGVPTRTVLAALAVVALGLGLAHSSGGLGTSADYDIAAQVSPGNAGLTGAADYEIDASVTLQGLVKESASSADYTIVPVLLGPPPPVSSIPGWRELE
jgi:hypothetical protein